MPSVHVPKPKRASTAPLPSVVVEVTTCGVHDSRECGILERNPYGTPHPLTAAKVSSKHQAPAGAPSPSSLRPVNLNSVLLVLVILERTLSSARSPRPAPSASSPPCPASARPRCPGCAGCPRCRGALQGSRWGGCFPRRKLAWSCCSSN